MATYRAPAALGDTGRSIGGFMLHLGEMLLAMVVGMAVFGAVFSGILVAAGTSFDAVLDAAPELIALVLMFNMTAPMVLWMRHRGHSRARVAEMAGAMLAVGLLACVLLWSSVIQSTAICGVECALMIPAMIAVMLVHRGEYSRPTHRPRTAAPYQPRSVMSVQMLERPGAPVETVTRCPGEYLSLTSFKRVGTGTATPVWFVGEEGALLEAADADAAGALYPLLELRLSPMIAAAAMALSSLSVVSNANRLGAWGPGPSTRHIEKGRSYGNQRH